MKVFRVIIEQIETGRTTVVCETPHRAEAIEVACRPRDGSRYNVLISEVTAH